MNLAQLIYVDGMVLISVAFPTLLVGMWAFDRAHQRTLAARAPAPVAEPCAARPDPMTLGATYYVIGVTLLSVVFPALVVRLWTWDQARRQAHEPRRPAAGALHAA